MWLWANIVVGVSTSVKQGQITASPPSFSISDLSQFISAVDDKWFNRLWLRDVTHPILKCHLSVWFYWMVQERKHHKKTSSATDRGYRRGSTVVIWDITICICCSRVQTHTTLKTCFYSLSDDKRENTICHNILCTDPAKLNLGLVLP